MNDIIKAIENEQLKSDITDFNVGDTVKVYAKVIEGSRERIQVYEGTVLKRQNGGAIHAAIKRILKANILKSYEVCKYIKLENGNNAAL